MSQSIEQWAKRLVAEAPPLTEEQLARLALLIGPALRASMTPATALDAPMPTEQPSERAA